MSGFKPFRFVQALGVIGRAKRVEQPTLWQIVVVIEHVHVEAALRAHQGGKETDRAGAGDQQRLRLPGPRTLTDAFGVVPGLGDDARRLEQDAGHAERRIDLDKEIRLDAEKVRAEAVSLLDAALGVAAVAAHIPFADGAAEQGTGSGRRTMPTTRSPTLTPQPAGAS